MPRTRRVTTARTAEFQTIRHEAFDPNTTTGHNGRMLRRVLLAALLCLAVWATVDGVACSPVSIEAAARTISCVTDAGGSTERPDHRWDAASRTSASITESVWKSQHHHAELAGAFCLDGCDAIRRTNTPQRQARHASWRLHDIPLLI